MRRERQPILPWFLGTGALFLLAAWLDGFGERTLVAGLSIVLVGCVFACFFLLDEGVAFLERLLARPSASAAVPAPDPPPAEETSSDLDHAA